MAPLFTRISFLAARPAPAEVAREWVLARHEGNFRSGAEEPLSLSEFLDLLGEGVDGDRRSREHAIACYLSGSEGWRDAVKELGGAFAGRVTGLRERKAD